MGKLGRFRGVRKETGKQRAMAAKKHTMHKKEDKESFDRMNS
jgi:hypothetical protein